MDVSLLQKDVSLLQKDVSFLQKMHFAAFRHKKSPK